MWAEISDLTYDGDDITGVSIRRGLESRPLWKVIEKMPPSFAVKWIDRFSPLEAIAAEWALAGAFELRRGLAVPDRAVSLRAFYLEMSRLLWSFNYLAELFNALQEAAIYQQALRLRELVFEAQETVTGSRVLPQIFEVGGVRRDMTPGEVRKIRNIMANIEYELRAFFKILAADLVLARRLEGLLPISKETAEKLSFRGPIGQASGIDRDLRRDRPFGAYEKQKIEVFTTDAADWFRETRIKTVSGDAFQRMRAVIFQLRQSVTMIGNLLDTLPVGAVLPAAPLTEENIDLKRPFWCAIEGGSGPVVAVLWRGMVRIGTHSIRMSPFIEEILTGVHREDYEVAAVSLGLDPSQVDLC